LISWGRKVETKIRLKRDKSGKRDEYSGVSERNGNVLKSISLHMYFIIKMV
jgi:hypothetical protein